MKRDHRLITVLRTALFGVLVVAIVATVAAQRTAIEPALPSASPGGFPLRFESVGRGDRVAYAADALNGVVSLDADGLALVGATPADGWKLALVAAAPDGVAQGIEPSLGPTNDLALTSASALPRDAAAYRSVDARSISPGVHASVSGTTDRVTLHLDLDAGTDPASVAFR